MKHVQFTLNISKELNDWLKEQAKLYNRSKNGHIAFLLETIQEQEIGKQKDQIESCIQGKNSLK